ncbi:BRCT domain-containing protein [Venturia nashicola]|uniref:RNA polymerase II subunit A C-terminal domain phosphatase n=1 Tax=Venturia nashicola TaxID=86259 RepID=A0A4Z1PAB6_9PEZI|nr:BRCT domain-containing protein [Venturia nashicola]
MLFTTILPVLFLAISGASAEYTTCSKEEDSMGWCNVYTDNGVYIYGMLIRSNPSLHYPITITKLLAKPDQSVDRFAPLFSYTYKTTVTEGNKYGDEPIQFQKDFPAEFQSELEGTLRVWKIKPGDVLYESGIQLVDIDEPCTHDTVFGGLCANCGQEMDKLDNYLTTERASQRATVFASHGNTALLVSKKEAGRINEEAKRRLLHGRKLSLVVDLDQTIIHATVDPTVAEWQQDPANPNYEAVKGVRQFQLVDDGPGGRGCNYYIKLRPGLEEFLEDIAKKYELHIYTMGTRAYAQKIAEIVDPQRRFFGDRILSRDESGSLTNKTLQRIFPVDTDMVVIIDDRGDVWQWSPNLIKVTPYDFFVGIGDINSSFLPKKTDSISKRTRTPPPPPPPAEFPEDKENDDSFGEAEAPTNGLTIDTTTILEDSVAPTLETQLVAMAGGDDPSIIEEKSNTQAETLAAQVTDRPLMKKQEMLDKLDEEEDAKENSEEERPVETAPDSKQRHNLLHDDDDELHYLQANLESIHRLFYEEYDQNIIASPPRLSQLRGEKSAKKTPVDNLELVPDVKDIMPRMKSDVLKHVVICFTGVIPQGLNHETSDIGMWARSFGARVSPNLTKSTTHVVAHKDRRTSKVRQAARHPNIQIVATSWLLECFVQWVAAPEGPHAIQVESDEHDPHDSLPFEELEEASMLTPSEDGGADDAVLPSEVEEADEEPNSPVLDILENVEWGDLEDEMKDFYDSEDETEADDTDEGHDEGMESDASGESGRSSRSTSSRKAKRKRRTELVNGDYEEAGESTSALQKRRKMAAERTTGLANVETLENPSGLPSPDTTGPEEDAGEKGKGVLNGVEGVSNGAEGVSNGAEGEVRDDDDGFEQEMMAEMMAEFDKDSDAED